MSSTPASEWKKANRKEVELASGRSVTIRKLAGDFLFAVQEITEKTIVAGEMATTVKLSPREQKKYVHQLVLQSVVSPKVVANDQEPKEDELQIADFGPDLDPLVAAIHDFNKEALQVPFRTPEAGESTPPVSPDVQPTAEPVAEVAA